MAKRLLTDIIPLDFTRQELVVIFNFLATNKSGTELREYPVSDARALIPIFDKLFPHVMNVDRPEQPQTDTVLSSAPVGTGPKE